MGAAYNGMPASGLERAEWAAGGGGDPATARAEMAPLPGGGVALRKAGDPDGPALIYTDTEIEAFIAGVKDGDFDHLID